MRRVHKSTDSKILLNNLRYHSGNSKSNKKISDELFIEQGGFCAYTEEYLSRTDARDIDHFDPTLKDTLADNPSNWFLVKHQWNKEKASKWSKYQPILHPTASDFEERVFYSDGDYFAKDVTDIEANNLITLLKLNDPALANNRKKYVKRKREEIAIRQTDAQTYFSRLVEDDLGNVSYLRVILEEFKVDIRTLL